MVLETTSLLFGTILLVSSDILSVCALFTGLPLSRKNLESGKVTELEMVRESRGLVLRSQGKVSEFVWSWKIIQTLIPTV